MCFDFHFCSPPFVPSLSRFFFSFPFLFYVSCRVDIPAWQKPSLRCTYYYHYHYLSSSSSYAVVCCLGEHVCILMCSSSRIVSSRPRPRPLPPVPMRVYVLSPSLGPTEVDSTLSPECVCPSRDPRIRRGSGVPGSERAMRCDVRRATCVARATSVGIHLSIHVYAYVTEQKKKEEKKSHVMGKASRRVYLCRYDGRRT